MHTESQSTKQSNTRGKDGLANADKSTPIGVIAGWGRLPFFVADALHQQGIPVAGIGVRDHADPRFAERCDHFNWIGVGGLGRAIRLLRRWGVARATMVGKIHKVMLLQPRWWIRHRPDLKTLRAFAPYFFTGTKDGKDDTLLGIVVELFASHGITFEPATDFAPELLVKSGQVAGRPLSAKLQKDVAFGWHLAKQMGALDIGQTVCIKDQIAMAIEAVEGTDLCIERAGQLCGKGGFTVVKVAKPRQDMRFDVPTVGVRTLNTIAAAGGNVLAIESDRTILLDDEEFRRKAERLKISVVALDDDVQTAAVA